ncbi:tumor necrosis factor receptor superfamily member 14-like isoform 1-T1 [Molossus nigricans]
MEPLQGWGLPPWSLTPKAGALRLTLCLLLLGVAHCARGMPSCPEEEFPVGAKCCPKCSPGHRVKEACGETTGTVCAPCSRGTYTANPNGLDDCLPCHLCDPDKGLVTRRKCSSTGNTVCGCDRGHFCVLVDGDHCAECRPHRDCRPGQRVQVTGTERQDTLCEDCPPGTFSAGGTQAVCEPWSKYTGLLVKEAKPGTNSTDVTCSSSVKVAILCVCTVIPVTVSLGYLIIRIRRSRDTGLVTRRKCSSTGNTVCGCDRGYFCVLVDGDHCAECRPHSDCRPGQRVQVTGTERQDTLCEVCPPGTFSTGGTQAVCEPWSKCSGPLEREAQPGTNSTDVTCSSSVTVAILCGCTVILVIFITVSLRYLIIRIRRSCGETSQKTHNVQVLMLVPPWR